MTRRSLRASWSNKTRTLSSAELYDCNERCPLCLADGVRKTVVRLQSEPEVNLLRCENCNGCSASLMPKPEILERYYKEYYEGVGEAAHVTFHNIRRLANHILKHVDLSPFEERIRILDFGGGDGSLSRQIANSLWDRGLDTDVEVALVDYSESPSVDGEGLSLTHVTDLDRLEGHYDLVLASAVLEHIPLVNESMRNLFSKAASPGYFYARTPYVEPFYRLTTNIDFSFPGHVHDMGDRFWGDVVRTLGLENAVVLASQPAIVETSFREMPLRTLAACLCKFPAHVEKSLFGSVSRRMKWTLVGGWEVFLKFDAARE